ncbi:MAG: hypothetical protein ACTS73_00560 [Arsenophonus sp. NEOnobi-MAG3]
MRQHYAVIRNGYLLQPTIQTGIGDVENKVPKIMDLSGNGICLTTCSCYRLN